MDNVELDLTGNETPEELEALLDKLGDVDVSDDAGTAPGNTAVAAENTGAQGTAGQADATQSNTGDTNTDTPTPGATTEQQQDAGQGQQAEQPKSILSKDGKHVIPYDVLEAERAEKRRIAEENQRTAAELEEAKRQLAVFTRQIASAGMTPATTPDKIQITPEQINSVRESFPEIGTVLDAMTQKIEYLQGQQPAAPMAQQSPGANPVMAALDATPDLKAWQTGDPDRFMLATHIDETLKNDSAWKDKPLAERFAEVAKRTRAAYGEAVDQPAQQQDAQQSAPAVTDTKQPAAEEIQQKAAAALATATAAAQLPASPSDVGQTATQSASLIEQAANADPDQLQTMFAGMTDAQIEALLEQI
ncbi:hypothetical protein [Brenneria corticis]|uniref:Uncharacterized protein n=1 Tax=Brenneria corticis TaxID=2173106 RepID=A0A2U1TMB2_9GAMM|nr:hypothetical protein [Brenneria sp. CFCC 11842]PWC10541.1 hypothetical protein DDT56_21775 [Brenneria sp. CFCC 11842]